MPLHLGLGPERGVADRDARTMTTDTNLADRTVSECVTPSTVTSSPSSARGYCPSVPVLLFKETSETDELLCRLYVG